MTEATHGFASTALPFARIAASEEYTRRINLVLDHISADLSGDLSLAALAGVAGFSPYHFHRLFKSLVGDNLNTFVVRKRLERAAALLKASPRAPITAIALDCGFSSLSDFSRTFKKVYGISPSRWDRHTALQDRKIWQAEHGLIQYNEEQLSDMGSEFQVSVQPFPAVQLAYIRIFDSYSGQGARLIDAYHRLTAWARARLGAVPTLIGMSQDDPDITPPEQCRYDLCVVAPPDFNGEGDISARRLPTGQVALLHCQGDIFQVDRAWQYLYRYWLPRSRYLPADLPAMEIYRRLPDEIGWETFDLDCGVPILNTIES